jgi:hypothetical protein
MLLTTILIVNTNTSKNAPDFLINLIMNPRFSTLPTPSLIIFNQLICHL